MTDTQGFTSPGFEIVREEFERNFIERGDAISQAAEACAAQ